MIFLVLFIACLGFLSPANRGALGKYFGFYPKIKRKLGTTAVTLFVLLGTPAGYTSARLYKTFGGERWKTNVLLTSFLVSGTVFLMFFIMNLILWGEGSSAAVPFTTILGEYFFTLKVSKIPF